LVTVTLAPALTVSGAPNWKSWIVIAPVLAPPPAGAEEEVLDSVVSAGAEELVGGALEAGVLASDVAGGVIVPEEGVSFEPQAATAIAAPAAAATMRRDLIMLMNTKLHSGRFTR
jgi:hypothetical protein